MMKKTLLFGLVFLVLISGALAGVESTTHGLTFNQGPDSVPGMIGFNVSVHTPITYMYVEKHADCAADQASIYNESGTNGVANASFSGNYANFSGIDLSAGAYYVVVKNADDSNIGQKYVASGGGYPFTGNHLDFITRTYWSGSWSYTPDWVACILNITTDNQTAAPPAPGDNTSISVSYDGSLNETVDGTHRLFFGNFSLTDNSTASVWYNGTEYAATINFTNENFVEFYTDITAPLVETNNSFFVFHWNYSLEFTDASTSNNVSSDYNQAVLWAYWIDSVSLADALEEQVLTSTLGVIDQGVATTNITYFYNQTQQTVSGSTVSLTTPFVYYNATDVYGNATLNVTYGANSYVRAYSGNTFGHNVSWNLTKYPRVNITAINLLTGAAVSNFTINGSSLTRATTSGEIYFWKTTNGTYPLTIDADGYAISTENVTFTLGGFGGHTFSIYTTNSFNFTFRDEETGARIYNVSIELISDVFANNYTTNASTLYVDLLVPSLYAMRYDSEGYTERFYYFNMTNRTHTELTFYLVNNVTATQVTATVYDEGNHPLEDTYVKVMRYNLATNSYTAREIAKTNFEGEAKVSVVLNDEFYKFLVFYPFSTLKKETSPTYITETTLALQITLDEAVAENFYNSQGVTYSLTFNNDSDNFRYTYTDGTESVTAGCLDIYKETALGSTLYNTSCITTSSSTILLGVAPTNGSFYTAKASVKMGTEQKYFLTSLDQSFEEDSPFGKLGIFLIILLTIVFVFMAKYSKAVALFITPLPLLFGSILNIVDVSLGICISLELICIIIAVWISRRG